MIGMICVNSLSIKKDRYVQTISEKSICNEKDHFNKIYLCEKVVANRKYDLPLCGFYYMIITSEKHVYS